MKDINAILSQRAKKSEHSSKMAAMAKQSSAGNLTSFSGIFHVEELNEKEKGSIASILKTYSQNEEVLPSDLETLISITSEVKAINNQAAILHGERIKRAHTILIRYRDGAFTAWLIAAYGNRQTPYNLMQYYEFYESMPKKLHPQIESMPRQAIYTLATRDGMLEKKQEIVEKYDGETKAELLQLIRQAFPLDRADQRRQNPGNAIINQLNKLCLEMKNQKLQLSGQQKKMIQTLLDELEDLVKKNNVLDPHIKV